jgi:bacillithiol biosynthesis cysteine-adding enzyme BshC
VVIDADSAILKEIFKPIIKQELTQQFAFSALESTTKQLEEKGFGSQITGKAINLFYLKDSLRERIQLENGVYKVNRTDLQFTQEEILAELDQHPERFSPNVVLRPVYQETILPNLAYLGGPAEVAYWFQLKGVFAEAKVPFPMIMPRAFGMVVPTPQHQRIEELKLTLEELMLPATELKELLLSREAMEPIDFSGAQAQLVQSFALLQEQAELWDKTLIATVQAELAKAQKGAENLEKRIVKAMENKFGTKANQALVVQQKLFPEGGLQERHSNILNFIMTDETLITDITNSINPLDFSFNIWYR